MNLSISQEWSGLIGAYVHQLTLAPWLLLYPLLMIALTIIALNLIIEGLKYVLEDQSHGFETEIPKEESTPVKQRDWFKIVHS